MIEDASGDSKGCQREGGPAGLPADQDGETRDQSPLPLEPANTFAARWDVASAQAIVVIRSTNAFGASQTDYWRVRFRGEVER